MSDSYIQVVPNSTGAKVDVSEITRADTTTVERQRIVISDPCNTDRHASVNAHGELSINVNDTNDRLDLIIELLEEIRDSLNS